MKFWKLSLVILTVVFSTNWLFAEDDEGKGRVYREMPSLPNHPVWKNECASCHQLYHPSLLPQRSWKKMMANLPNHFGENASLDEKVRADIEQFLSANSADKSNNRRAQKFLRSIPANEAPLRISETEYFKRKHDEISPALFKRNSIGSAANCMACHSTAERGYFDEHGVKIPKALPASGLIQKRGEKAAL